jgi:hypothetical protein
MSNRPKRDERISIEQSTWYYITLEDRFLGFASFNFVKYIDAIIVKGSRKAALVRFLDQGYFPSKELVLLPYSLKRNYFLAKVDEEVPILTFDASKVGDGYVIDLKSEWPNNILDRAVITPSYQKARQLTGL